MTPPAPHLKNDRCSDCGAKAISAASGEMRICPTCFAVLWHCEDKTNPRAVELAAQQRRLRAERDRKRQERRAAYLDSKERGPL